MYYETDTGVDDFLLFGDGCAADINEDGILNVFDFLLFQPLSSKGNLLADFAAPYGVLNVFDFLAFQTALSEGW